MLPFLFVCGVADDAVAAAISENFNAKLTSSILRIANFKIGFLVILGYGFFNIWKSQFGGRDIPSVGGTWIQKKKKVTKKINK